MSSRKYLLAQKKTSKECLSTPTFVDDELTNNNSMDEDSNSQTKHSNSITNDEEPKTYRRRKQTKFQNPKSHRVIEKRRRDRMNHSLDHLLELIPHKKPDNERRIEKTEIIEMAVKYIRSLKPSTPKSFDPIDLNRKSNLKIDAYSSGYHNGACETLEYIEKHSTNQELFPDLIHHIQEKELALKSLTVVPGKKASLSFSKSSSHTSDHENLFQFSIDDQSNSPPSNLKVPIFVLHPSGTHYIPMSVDFSLVSHAFHSKAQSSKSIHEQPQCHPISIPVNFNPLSATSDAYELDFENINVIATRHQTSVRPN